MTKKSFKRVFSTAFVTGLAVLAASNVDALSIRENVNKEITDGSYIIGISKFTPDQVLTGVKVSKATINDMVYNKGLANYAGPSIYYYDFGAWFELDENNKYNQVSDTKILASLNSRDVFYVNNVEKAFDVSYSVQVPDGKKVMFKTDVENREVVYSNGALTIPASVSRVTAYLVDEDADKVDGGKVLDVIEKKKESLDATDFEYVTSSNSTGSVAADGIYTAKGDVAINGNNITVGGTIGWTNGTENGGYDAGAGAGHRIGLRLTVPNGTDLTAGNLSNIKMEYTSSLDEKDALPRTTTWAESITDKDNQFWFTPVVKSGEVITLKVKWSEGIEQVFTITVAGTLEEMPAGALSGKTLYVYDEEKKEYTSEARLTASVNSDNDVVTFNGKSLDWKYNEVAHTTNKVTVLVTPDEYYSSQKDFKLSSVVVSGTHKVYNSTEDKWEDKSVDAGTISSSVVDGKIAIDVALGENVATKKNRVVTVKLEWDKGYTQSFDVVLDDRTNFVYPNVSLVSAAVDTNGVEKSFNPETDNNDKPTNTVIVKGYIDWDTAKGGNPVRVKLNTSAFDSEEVKNLSVRVNGKVLTTTNGDEEVNLPVTSAADYSFDFVAEQKSYTVELLWNGERVVNTYTVNVTASLEEAPEGAIAYKSAGAQDKVTGAYSRSAKTLTVYTNGEDVKIPYVYGLASTAVNIALENSDYSNVAKKVEVTLDGNTYVAEPNGDAYAVKVQAGKTTTVTVTWDSLNTQTFKVVADKDAAFATAETGKAVYSPSYNADDFAAEGVSTALTINQPVTEWNNGYTLENNVMLKPADTSLTAIGDGAYMTITGGAYDNYRVEKKTLEGMFNSTNKVLELPIRIVNANDSITVTICWGGSYVETYKITVVDATLNASTNAKDVELFVDGTADAVLTAEKKYKNSNLVYAGTIAYTGGYHSLTAKMANTTGISKITVVDAESAAAGKDTVYENTSLTAEFDLNFTNAIRKATVTIEYTDGYVQTIVVDGTNAKLPTINLSNNLDKDEKGNYIIDDKTYSESVYKYTAKVGDKIYLYNSTSPLGLDVNVTIDSTLDTNGNLALDGKNAVLENVGTGTISAKAVGVTVVKLELDGTDPIFVEVSVLPEQAVSISNAKYVIDDTDENNITATVTANVAGGYYSSYDVTVARQTLVNGKYTSIESAEVVTAVNDNGVWTATFDNIDAEAKYKFTIVAVNSYYNEMKDNAAFAATTSLETTPTAYTVKLNNTYGDITLASNIVPGSTIDLPKVDDIKRPNATKEGVEYTYTFAGWYKASDVDANGIAKDNTSAVIAKDTASIEVASNLDLVAAWVETKAEYTVKFIYADATDESSVVSGEAIANPNAGTWYIDNSENFDSEGKLTNNAKAYDFTTKATGNITLKTEASK